MKALLFGSIGVFCDSSDLQRQAYNQAFTEVGLDWYWDAPLYKNLLLTPGGKARVARFASEYDVGAKIDFTAIHQRKTALYASMLAEQGQTIRVGVVRLVQAARANGIKVGWVTSTEYANLEAIMSRSEGKLSPADFDVIIHRDEALDEKPDPSPYFSALAQLGLEAEQVVAIEDTAACMRSATRADIACIVTPHRFSLGQDYYEATSVVSALGDPAEPASLIEGEPVIDKQGLVTLQTLHNLTGSMQEA